MVETYSRLDGINRLGEKNLPDQLTIASILTDLRALMFPGYFGPPVAADADLEALVADLLDNLEGPCRTALKDAGLAKRAAHVAFEGMDTPLGKAQIKFVRSIPMEKAMSSTLLAYEMNGDPLPLKHGYPLRALALGWTGANCVKWLNRIVVLEKPYSGFFMDKVYRVFQKGEKPETGEIVSDIQLKSIITRPLTADRLERGEVVVLGAAYAGEGHVAHVEVSVDEGATWQQAEFIGPDEPYAWRQWQYAWQVDHPGEYTIRSRATDDQGKQQPATAQWNFLGYGNNGVDEHAVKVVVI